MRVASSSYLFTSESVSEGHPDKICDRISDAILDGFLREDPYSRVAVETLATTNRVVLAGETRGPKTMDADRMEAIARECIKNIGYEQEAFTGKTRKWIAMCMSNRPKLPRVSMLLAIRTRGR